MKRTKLNKYSKADIPRLKRRLWKALSLFIRVRDEFTCFTCGRQATGSGMHAGHLIPAGMSSAVRFDELNLAGQCYHCNINLFGNGAVYSQRFIQKYGKEAFDDLIRRSKEVKQWTVSELEVLIEKYEKSVSKSGDKLELQFSVD